MKGSNEQYAIGAALIEALEPLIDVCLEAGITSPALEKILRAAFVERAFKKLPRHQKSGRPATANKVAFATGLHWTDVARVQKAKRANASKKLVESEELGLSRAARVIEGWTKDPNYLTSGGHPIDLPLRRIGKRRSFRDLVSQYSPKTPFGTLLQELTRRGQAQLVEGEIVRFKRATAHRGGLTPAALADASRKIKRLGETMYSQLKDSDGAGVYDETPPLKLSAAQMALVRPRLERHVKNFLAAVENELRARDGIAVPDGVQDYGVSVFSWKD